METIRGKTSHTLDLNGLMDQIANYKRIDLDLGTGDGRFVRSLADRYPDQFIIGVDTCRENLRDHSRAKLPNLLFVIASAQNLPRELNGLISHITINFPWGSLLESLLNGDESLLNGLSAIAQMNACIDIYLNGGAMAEHDIDMQDGAIRIQENLLNDGWQCAMPIPMNRCALQAHPTTWAKRLVHGRDARAMKLSGILIK